MRELRKDARFLAEERARAVARNDASREASQRAALTFLQQQQADFRSGGQGGMAKGLRRKATGPQRRKQAK